jgi:hypothetical protein
MTCPFASPLSSAQMRFPCMKQRDAELGAPTVFERSLPALGVFIRFG